MTDDEFYLLVAKNYGPPHLIRSKLLSLNELIYLGKTIVRADIEDVIRKSRYSE